MRRFGHERPAPVALQIGEALHDLPPFWRRCAGGADGSYVVEADGES
jgi:hypothetical protein